MATIIKRDLGRPAQPWKGWVALGFSAGIAALIPGFLGSQLLGIIPITGMNVLGFILGAIAGQYYFAKLIPQFFVRTSQAMMFVATSPYTGIGLAKGSPNVVFPEATLTPTVPFMGREDRGNVPMELTTLKFKFSVPGKEEEIFAEGIYQYRVDPEQAAGYVGFSDATILAGIVPKVRADIAKKIERKTLDEAKSRRPSINKALSKELGGVDSKEQTDFEKTYCIISENIIIEQFAVGPEVQKSRDAVAQSTQMLKAVAKMFNFTEEELKVAIAAKTISTDQLREFYNLALVQSGKTQQTIETKRFDGLEGVAKALGEGIATAMMAAKK